MSYSSFRSPRTQTITDGLKNSHVVGHFGIYDNDNFRTECSRETQLKAALLSQKRWQNAKVPPEWKQDGSGPQRVSIPCAAERRLLTTAQKKKITNSFRFVKIRLIVEA